MNRSNTGETELLTEQMPSTRIDEVLKVLSDNGYPVTDQRRKLVSFIVSCPGRFTANSLLGSLSRDGISVGRATVFRTLDILVRFGYVRRMPDGERPGYAICSPDHHHHLVCSNCGRVLRFEECPVSSLLVQLEERTGYQIAQHQLELAGICPSCQD